MNLIEDFEISLELGEQIRVFDFEGELQMRTIFKQSLGFFDLSPQSIGLVSYICQLAADHP